MFSFFKKKTEGLISFFNLFDFWDSLEDSERNLLELKYGDDLTKGKPEINGSSSYFLASLSSFVNTKEHSKLCEKIINESIKLLKDEKSENLHFIYDSYIDFFYRNRDSENNLEKAIEYCKKQIELSPESAKEIKNNEFFVSLPIHKGYEQLAIIYKKNKQWQDVIDLCEKGKSEGWTNDFDKRIEEAKGKF